MDITSAAAAMGSLKSALDIAQAVIRLGVSQAVQAQIWEMNGKMIETQQAIFAIGEERTALAQRVGELEGALAAREKWDAEKARDQLTAFRPGLFCYRLKPDAEGMEPPHDLCARCYERGEKSILQGERQTFAGHETMMCPSCKTELRYFRDDLPKRPKRPIRNPSW